ncbi:tyrosine-type recombinase/integrase [Agarivorans sp. B2Z047]|uniref:tyrosine-type recombinase/integrase n=1 Tax=Agarivorans sp. B2Z047 TaxID=2652721 RepID=UPI00128C4863|nr:tyrosine-type recombinase/integrase [Agarivorans sp. B2Z047]MPW28421.1 tyrosine-type recombinase/integrase [Agarivorans sp. B2Z047]UQN40986.1 tyrosine-type recombinase/integrase [Agarivorans sp. B2Z047]
MAKKLTVKEVQTAKGKAGVYRLSDGGNLYLCVRPGGTKSWQFRYKRPAQEKVTYLSFGTYPDVSLAEARDKALQARKLVSEGIDPQLVKAERKAQVIAEQCASFSRVAVLWKDSKVGSLKEKTLHDNWRKLELYAFPKLGSIPVSKLTAPMAIAAPKPTEQKGLYETVKRTAQLMNEIMNFAVNSGLIHSNPLVGIREVFRRHKVIHMKALKPEELHELIKTVATANMHRVTRFLIEWQLHTMTRPSEASGARWAEIDVERGIWVIPAERMKMKREHIIPLTQQTLSILEALRPFSGHREYVFPSPRNPRKPVDSETANKALGRMGFKDRTTAHGLRALASTTLNEQRFDADVIEAALAHADKDKIRSAYNRTDYLESRKKMMDWWSRHIEKSSFGSYSVSNSGNDLKLVSN